MKQSFQFVIVMVLLQFSTASHAQKEVWVDSILKKMTLDEKIGQLFIIRAHTDLGDDHIASVKQQIKKYHVGGMCFFQGTPEKQAAITAEYQQLSKVPLFVSVDAEWGIGMRFKDKGLSFPRQLMLGAIRDYSQIESMGFAIGKQLQALGVNVSYSPVADININPLNPVIGDRSFGEDKQEVAKRSIAYMKGLRSAGILACGKHFPGHGDTDVDSHLDLPVLNYSMERLRDIELYPFQQLIDAGMPGIMVAHLHVPAIDSTANISTTLSGHAINELLINEMKFRGLVFTDALEMKGVTKNFKADEVAIMAYKAGNDLLVLPDNMEIAYNGMKTAFSKGKLPVDELDRRVRKILSVKYDYGLDSLILPDPANAKKMAFDPAAIGIKQKLIEEAITIVQNKRALIPMVNIVKPKFATIAFGSSVTTPFQKRLDSYFDADHFDIPHSLSGVDEESLLRDIKRYDRIIVSFHNMTNKVASNFGLTQDELALLQKINRDAEIIVVIFGSPYSLKFFENIDHLIMAYEDNPETEDLAAQALVGVFGCSGKLPVTVSNIFPLGHGFTTPSLKRLGYSIPERVGMSSDSLDVIARIAKQMIREKAAPGCQVLVAKDGRIVYEKTFGFHTYEKADSVLLTDLYDIASITKVAATTETVMRLYSEGIIDINKTLGDYLPWIKGSNKEHMVLKKVMAHHAGLQSWIPFYEKTIKMDEDSMLFIQPEAYCDFPSEQYAIPVAGEMFLDIAYRDTIREQIIKSGLNADGTYVYSDLGFIMLAEIIQNLTGVRLDQYVDSVFYKPLGLDRIGYLPLLRFSEKEIIPSEIDEYFRCQELLGEVHDMACAMFGGVCGHAGIFSNAHDLAVLFQMMMNEGTYGGTHFIDPVILQQFTTRHVQSTRRGIGFDMKELNNEKKVLTSPIASAKTYGHTGFTGTCVWNDPVHQLTFVFLSNRTYPTMKNSGLSYHAIRERMHTRAYKAIEGFKSYQPEMIQG
jgi:beta-N-acetylhexosaminidase